MAASEGVAWRTRRWPKHAVDHRPCPEAASRNSSSCASDRLGRQHPLNQVSKNSSFLRHAHVILLDIDIDHHMLEFSDNLVWLPAVCSVFCARLADSAGHEHWPEFVNHAWREMLRTVLTLI